MGCGSSRPGVVIASSDVQQTQRTVVMGNQPAHYTGSQSVQRVQAYPTAQQQHGPPPVYPAARQPYPTQTRGYVQQGAVPHTTVVQQPVVYQDRGSDMIVGMAAGAMVANAMHGHHHHGYHGYHGYDHHHGHHETHIHHHDHDHFHNSENHGGYDGGGGGFDGGYDGAVEGGGFDGGYDGAVEGGGGFDDGGGGFDDGGGFDGGDFD